MVTFIARLPDTPFLGLRCRWNFTRSIGRHIAVPDWHPLVDLDKFFAQLRKSIISTSPAAYKTLPLATPLRGDGPTRRSLGLLGSI